MASPTIPKSITGDLNVELGHARHPNIHLVSDRYTLGALGRDLSW